MASGTSGSSSASNASVSAAISVGGLTRHFRTGRGRNRRVIEAVSGISFDVDPGERIAFIGPNGAGKSTSIKMLTGLLHPAGGEAGPGTATVLGLVPWAERRRLAANVGSLFGQRSQLWSELAPRASYDMLGAIFGLDRPRIRRRVDELTGLLDLGELVDQPVRTQSLGQRMRCELGAVLLHEPSLVFLDEPTIGLDLLAKQRFRDVLVRLNTELGVTVFLTSHDVADVEHVANRAIVINDGRIIADALVDELRGSFLSSKRVRVGLERREHAEVVLAIDLDGVVAERVSDWVVRLEVDTMAALFIVR